MIRLVVVCLLLLQADVSLAAENVNWRDLDAASLQVETRRLLNSGNYDELIRQLTELRASDSIEVRKFAQEFLGVARERKGQFAFARAEYERFLSEYGDESEAGRVRMRLAALLESSRPDPEAGNATEESVVAQSSSSIDGSLRFDYRGGWNKNNGGDSTRSLSLASTDLDLTSQHERENLTFGTRISLGHYEDLMDAGKNTRDRVRYLYVDVDAALRVRLGRQRARRSAFLGRFDGADFRYQLNSGPVVGITLGAPVESSSSDLFADSRQFVALGISSGSAWGNLEVGLQGLHQTIDGHVDRQTVGSEVRFVKGNVFAQGLVDYDLHFKELNALLVNLNIASPEKTSFNLTYDFRKSPFLSTRNALIGQALANIDDLLTVVLTEEDLADLALDRSLNSQYLTIGASHPGFAAGTLSGSVSWFSIDAGVASGGLTATPAYDQLQVDVRLFMTDVFTEDHNLTIGVNYSSQESLDSWSVYTSSRISFGNHFRLLPKIRINTRQYSNGNSQTHIYPELRAEYSRGSHYAYLVTGYHRYTNSSVLFPDQQMEVLLTYLGYQYRF